MKLGESAIGLGILLWLSLAVGPIWLGASLFTLGWVLNCADRWVMGRSAGHDFGIREGTNKGNRNIWPPNKPRPPAPTGQGAPFGGYTGGDMTGATPPRGGSALLPKPPKPR